MLHSGGLHRQQRWRKIGAKIWFALVRGRFVAQSLMPTTPRVMHSAAPNTRVLPGRQRDAQSGGALINIVVECVVANSGGGRERRGREEGESG
jgi:hypothetical protein